MSAAGVDMSRTEAWLLAARPQTLPAAAAPVIVGSGLATHESIFEPLPALIMFVSIVLIQIGTNFANDYYDAINGVDTEDREGFTRVTQAGIIPAWQVKLAALAMFALAILTDIYLVYVGGVPILICGLVSVFCGWAYSGGPYPLGYHGLGDLLVFFFFGIVAVVGTYYIQAVATVEPFVTTIPEGTVPREAFLASLPIAGLSTAMIVVNNIRDRETDAKTGKQTLAVRIGYRASRIEFTAMLALAYLTPIWFRIAEGFDTIVLLPLVSFPYAAMIARTIWSRTDGDALNPALKATGKLLALYAVLFAAGLMI